MTTLILVTAVALGVTLAALIPFRQLAIRLDIMDNPGPRKSHSAPVPYLGGLAILTGFGVSVLVLAPARWNVVLMLTFVAVLGLIDDLRYLPVWVKLSSEIALALAAVGSGFAWHLTDSVPINAAISIVWIVGITNAFNLLDNMDGLATTVAAGSLIVLAALVPSQSLVALPLCAAALAFLAVNRPPALMYMGDAGSLMLGFGVALISIAAADSQSGLHSAVILAFPLATAILDTSLVVVSRLVTGRPIQLGGKDHFSHRLRQIGWSPRRILLGAAVGSFTAWVGAVLALRYPLPDSWLAVPIGGAFVAAWVVLLRVDPYTSAISGLRVYRDQSQS